MPNSYSRRNRSNNSTLALLSKPPLAPAPQVEGRLVTPGGVGQHSPAHGGHHSIAKPRDFAIVMLFLQTGLRVSELVNLKIEDVDFVSRELTVRQGKGRKDRVVPLVGQASAALKTYLAVRDGDTGYENVFLARNGTSMDVRTVRYRIHKYYEEAGIKKKKKASVHTLRHTFATHQIHNGLKLNQLKEVLGHRQMETTYKYVHLDRTNLRQEMEQGAL